MARRKTTTKQKPDGNGDANADATTTALAPQPESQWAALRMGPSAVKELILQNVGVGGFSQFDLDKARMPSGTGMAWDLQSGEGADSIKEFEGVIIHKQDARRYWEVPYGEGDPSAPPDCYSDDGIHGHGEPAERCGGLCEGCQFAQFGSEVKRDGEAGRGQACKQVQQLFVVRTDELLPLVIVLPATSLKPARRYFLRLISKLLYPHQVVTKFNLAQVTNPDGIKHAVVQMSRARQLDPDEAAAFEAMRDAFMPSLKRTKARIEDFSEGGADTA